MIQNVIGIALVVVGLAFMFIGSLGIVRLPDFFTRTHAASKVDTVGVMVVLIGIAIIEGFNLTSGKVLLAAFILMLTNPVAAHALARAAYHRGLKPWKKGEKPSDRTDY